MTITDHKTIFAYAPEQLDALIANAITEGWQPLGGVTAASEPGRGVVLYRAMVRYGLPETIWLPPGMELSAVPTNNKLTAGETSTAVGGANRRNKSK